MSAMALALCSPVTSRKVGSRPRMEFAAFRSGEFYEKAYARNKKKKLLTTVGNIQGIQSLASTKTNEVSAFELLVSMREFKKKLLIRDENALGIFQSPASTKANENCDQKKVQIRVGNALGFAKTNEIYDKKNLLTRVGNRDSAKSGVHKNQ